MFVATLSGVAGQQVSNWQWHRCVAREMVGSVPHFSGPPNFQTDVLRTGLRVHLELAPDTISSASLERPFQLAQLACAPARLGWFPIPPRLPTLSQLAG